MGRSDRTTYGILVALLLGAESAPAAQYNLIANAGGVSEGETSLDDPSVAAASTRNGATGGEASYTAAADVSVGAYSASMSITDGNLVSFGLGGLTATARFEETIAFKQSLAESVTIVATMDAVLEAETPSLVPGPVPGAVAAASARVDLASCWLSQTRQNGVTDETTYCENAQHGWQADDGAIVVVVDPAIFPNLDEIAFEGQAIVQFSSPTSVLSGEASVNATVYLSLTPEVAFEFTGSQTAFPAPEPGSTLVAWAAFGALCMRSRCGARA